MALLVRGQLGQRLLHHRRRRLGAALHGTTVPIVTAPIVTAPVIRVVVRVAAVAAAAQGVEQRAARRAHARAARRPAVAAAPVGGCEEEPRLALQAKLRGHDLVQVPGEQYVEHYVEAEHEHAQLGVVHQVGGVIWLPDVPACRPVRADRSLPLGRSHE